MEEGPVAKPCIYATEISDKGLRQLRGLKLLHTKVCSLPKKLTEINFIVNKYHLDILSINETHLDSTINDFELNITGFSLYRNDRNRHGGGVAIYIRDEIKHKLRSDLFFVGLESVWVELMMGHPIYYVLCIAPPPPPIVTKRLL